MQTQREDKSKIDNPNIKISNLSSLKEVKVTARKRRDSLSVLKSWIGLQCITI